MPLRAARGQERGRSPSVPGARRAEGRTTRRVRPHAAGKPAPSPANKFLPNRRQRLKPPLERADVVLPEARESRGGPMLRPHNLVDENGRRPGGSRASATTTSARSKGGSRCRRRVDRNLFA